MNTIEELDTYVQTTLKDHSMSPWRRAKEAARAIRAQVMAEEGLGPDTPLPIPIEWEHRVSGLVDLPFVVDELGYAEVGYVEGEPVATPTEFDLVIVPPVLDGDGSHDEVAAELMKEAFDAEFIGDEDLAQQRFDKFWERDS